MNHCLCVKTYRRCLAFNSQLPITWVGPNSPLPFPPRGSINLWWEQQQITLERGEIRPLCFWWFIIHFSIRQPCLISTHLIHTCHSHTKVCAVLLVILGVVAGQGRAGLPDKTFPNLDLQTVSALILLPGHPKGSLELLFSFCVSFTSTYDLWTFLA